jgi:hypothetical protein
MRRQVTVGGLVALALLTGSVVAYAAPPAPPGECAAVAGAEGASPGLVPGPRVSGQDEPDPDGDGGDPDPDDGGDPGDDPADDSDDGTGDEDPADEDPADEDPPDEDPADDSGDGSGDDGSGDDASDDDSDDASGEDQALDQGEDSGEEPADGDAAGGDSDEDPAATTPGAAPADPAAPAGAPDGPAADETVGDTSDAPAADACASPTAAEALGWGVPAAVDEFDGPLGGDWRVYSGSGFDGQGTRTADALTVDDGVLTITGDEAGATGGMAWATGQEYGRWEARVRTPESDPSYNALLLLWPDDPAAAGSETSSGETGSGEIDFMEMLDPARQTANAFVHPGAEAAPAMGEVAVDGTAWHTWAVEWTPTAVTTYVDGVRWWSVDDPAQLPSGPMHLCVQLDWFPTGDGEVRESSMQVDWVRQYTLDAAPSGADDPEASTDPAPAAPSAERLSEGAPDVPARPGLVAGTVRSA